MPQLGTADVTYTTAAATALASPGAPMREQQFLLLFPNSTNVLYTNGGIPLNKAALGCPAALVKFLIEDMASSTGYVAKWDQSANTIRLYASAGFGTGTAVAAAQLVEVLTSATVASCTLRVVAQGF